MSKDFYEIRDVKKQELDVFFNHQTNVRNRSTKNKNKFLFEEEGKIIKLNLIISQTELFNIFSNSTFKECVEILKLLEETLTKNKKNFFNHFSVSCFVPIIFKGELKLLDLKYKKILEVTDDFVNKLICRRYELFKTSDSLSLRNLKTIIQIDDDFELFFESLDKKEYLLKKKDCYWLNGKRIYQERYAVTFLLNKYKTAKREFNFYEMFNETIEVETKLDIIEKEINGEYFSFNYTFSENAELNYYLQKQPQSKYLQTIPQDEKKYLKLDKLNLRPSLSFCELVYFVNKDKFKSLEDLAETLQNYFSKNITEINKIMKGKNFRYTKKEIKNNGLFEIYSFIYKQLYLGIYLYKNEFYLINQKEFDFFVFDIEINEEVLQKAHDINFLSLNL